MKRGIVDLWFIFVLVAPNSELLGFYPVLFLLSSLTLSIATRLGS